MSRGRIKAGTNDVAEPPTHSPSTITHLDFGPDQRSFLATSMSPTAL